MTKQFNELNEDKTIKVEKHIRSETMLLFDLKNWGYRYKVDTKRPYFEGHERSDVVIDRENYIRYFIDRQDHYYRVDENNMWILPTEKPCVLIFHDESTFKSGEVAYKRWMKDVFERFYNKGVQLLFQK